MNNRTNPQIGDLIEFKGWMYRHWAVYIGNNMVAHLVGCKDNGKTCYECKNSEVRHDSFPEVKKRYRTWRINNLLDAHGFEVRTAEGILEFTERTKGPRTYDIVNGNCEHYVMLCRYGVNISFQVEALKANVPGFLGAYKQLKSIKRGWLEINETVPYFDILTWVACGALLALTLIELRKN
ncbi:phospholipase A and acyltransferase 4-like [Crassostrea virginica]